RQHDDERDRLLEGRLEHPGGERGREVADAARRGVEQRPAGAREHADHEVEDQPGHPERGDREESDQDEAADVAEAAGSGLVLVHLSIPSLANIVMAWVVDPAARPVMPTARRRRSYCRCYRPGRQSRRGVAGRVRRGRGLGYASPDSETCPLEKGCPSISMPLANRPDPWKSAGIRAT